MNLQQCFDENYQALFRFAYRMVGRRELAEEAAQEAFLRLVKKGSASLEAEGSRRWLFVVTRDFCLSYLRRGAKNAWILLDALCEPSSDRPSPAQSALAHERGLGTGQ